MSDDKNQDAVDQEAARRLAEQRKALNLQTQPLEVIADLDWGVDDSDAVFMPPPAAEPVTKKTEIVPPAEAKKSEPEADVPVSSGGTMMMSASDFRSALQEESAKAEKQAEAQIEAAEEVVSTRGGTMLISGADVEEALEAAKAEAAAEDAQQGENDEAQQTAGGTMLMSTAAINAQLEEEAGVRAAQQTPDGEEASDGSSQPSDEVKHSAHEPQKPQWEDEPKSEAPAVWNAPKDASPAPTGGFAPNRIAIGVAVVVILILLFFLMR